MTNAIYIYIYIFANIYIYIEMDAYGYIYIHMGKYKDFSMGPWAKPMGPNIAAGPWPMGPGSGSLAQGKGPSRHLWDMGLAHGPMGSICSSII